MFLLLIMICIFTMQAIDNHSNCVPAKVIKNSEFNNFPDQNITTDSENIDILASKELISSKQTSGTNLSMESIEYLSNDE